MQVQRTQVNTSGRRVKVSSTLTKRQVQLLKQKEAQDEAERIAGEFCLPLPIF